MKQMENLKMSSSDTFLSSSEELSDQGLKARLSFSVDLDATVSILSVFCNQGLASPALVLDLTAAILSAFRKFHIEGLKIVLKPCNNHMHPSPRGAHAVFELTDTFLSARAL